MRFATSITCAFKKDASPPRIQDRSDPVDGRMTVNTALKTGSTQTASSPLEAPSLWLAFK